MWTKLFTGFVGYFAIEINFHRDHVFLNGDCIVKIAFAVQKLLKPDQGVIYDFFLCVLFGIKYHIFSVAIANNWGRPLAERVDVNTKSIPNGTHNFLFAQAGSACF